MSRFSKKLALLCALGGLSLSLTGCHGSKGLPEFTVPEEFDTSRNYEITFWAKIMTLRWMSAAVYTKPPAKLFTPQTFVFGHFVQT